MIGLLGLVHRNIRQRNDKSKAHPALVSNMTLNESKKMKVLCIAYSQFTIYHHNSLGE